MLTYINLPQTDRAEDIPKATCKFPQRLLTVHPPLLGLGKRCMNPVAPSLRLDLDNTYGSQFTVWQFLPASLPNARQKPDWVFIKRATRSRLPLLQGNPNQHTILRIVQFSLKGVQS